MIPALASILLGPSVPSDPERLEPAAWQLDQILLEWRDAECIADLEIRELSIRPVGADPEFAVLLEERALDAVLGEGSAVKVSENGLLSRLLHGSLMLGCIPIGMLSGMALGTTHRSHEALGSSGRGRLPRKNGDARTHKPNADCQKHGR